MSHHSRGTVESSAANRARSSRPRSIVRIVPPASWMAMISAGLPARRAAAASVCAMTCSHPSATTSTAPTLGWAQYAASVACVTRMSGPSWPHPARCGKATTASGFTSAMRSHTTDEQITVGTTST